jgi:hypothetical protein
MFRKLIVSAALTTAIALGASAQQASAADWLGYHIDPARVDKAFNTAVNAWTGELSHCVASGITLYGYTAAEDPEDAGDYAYTPDLYACEIYFNVDDSKNYNYPWFCSVMVHEMGHVAGYEHTRKPRDIMTATNEVYWKKCLTKRQYRRYHKRHMLIDRSVIPGQGESGSRAYSSSVRPPDVGRHLRAQGIKVHRIATLPVR